MSDGPKTDSPSNSAAGHAPTSAAPEANSAAAPKCGAAPKAGPVDAKSGAPEPKSGGSYDPKSVEPRIYEFWEQGNYFHAQPPGTIAPTSAPRADTTGRIPATPKPYTIVIPPPNVTGALHLGHAINSTLQDILIRNHRMRGFVAEWMPGVDHAGIATQAVVEKRIRTEQNLTRHQIGREGLVQKIWEWKEEYAARILGQLRKIGCSCDWQRTRFTLDETCAKAVYEAFFRMFKDGLIYRGLRLVNWDAALQTAVADDEIVHETVKGSLWHIRYPIVKTCESERVKTEMPGAIFTSSHFHVITDSESQRALSSAAAPDAQPGAMPTLNVGMLGADAVSGRDFLVVATTRPETMLADTAVAVHPDDPRYKHLIGQHVMLPLMNRRIPIIGDAILVNPEFGTGCVKVTPGHDPNDHATWQRHQGQPDEFGIIDLLTPDGKINDSGKGTLNDYSGMKKEDARKKVVTDLEALGLLEKVEPYETQVGHSDRSKTPIEPLRSEQWFVKVEPSADDLNRAAREGRTIPRLAEMAIEAVRDGRVQFTPARYANTYMDWLGEKRDWCISRQLWWGHRIPVWSSMIPNDLGGDCDDLSENGEMSERLHKTFGELQEYFDAAGVGDDIAIRPERNATSTWLNVCARSERAVRAILAINCAYGSWMGPEEAAKLGIPVKKAKFICDFDEIEASDDDFRRLLRMKLSDAGLSEFGQSEEDLDRLMNVSLLEAPYRQDPDVLDTWFSSGLWPFSTFGWPDTENNHDLDYFFPTDTLVTARGIITLWVARMVMMSLYLTGNEKSKAAGRVPFKNVVIYPTIQDAHGRTMSKSLGNGVDPLDLIELFGTDALRFVLAQLATETQDIRVPVKAVKLPDGRSINTSDRFEAGRNLCNKLWQAATGLVMPNLSDEATKRRSDEGQGEARRHEGTKARSEARTDQSTIQDSKSSLHDSDSKLQTPNSKLDGGAYESPVPLARGDLALEDRWILSRLGACIALCDRSLALFQFSAYADALYSFFWNDYCDWYLELTKPRLATRNEAGEFVPRGDASANVARQILGWVLDQTLRLMHPVMPFITEELWHRLNERAPQRGVTRIEKSHPALITAAWPDAAAFAVDAEVEREMEALQTVIRALRDIRASVNALRASGKQPSMRTLPKAVIRTDAETAARLNKSLAVIQRLGNADALEIGPDVTKPSDSMSKVLAGVEVYVSLAGLADPEIERTRLRKDRDDLAPRIEQLDAKLSNEGFVAKAPAAVVEKDRGRLAEMKQRLAAIDKNMAELG